MWLPILCFAALVALKLLADWRRDRLKNYPPGPPCLPLLGNLHQLSRLLKRTGFHWDAWARLRELYGPVVRLRLGLTRPILVLSGQPAVFELLGRRDFDGRPDNFETRNSCGGKRRGIVLNDGRDWAQQKRFLLKVLKDFGFGKRVMEDSVIEDANMLCDIVSEKMLNKEVDIHDFSEVASIAVVSSLWSLIAGRRCDPIEEESEMLEVLRILKVSFRQGSTMGALWQHIPLLRYIMPKYSGYEGQNKRLAIMLNYFSKEVNEHKKTRIPGEPRDLIDKYLEEIESQNNNETSSFDELQLLVLLKDLFAAGIDTTSNTIGFFVAYLAKYSDTQDRIQMELDRVIGDTETLRSTNKASLPLLSASIAEVARLANVAPSTLPHRATVDCSLLGYDVKRDWSLIANLHSVHMDAGHWIDPEAFRPERFIDSSGNFADDPWLIPFGHGRRKCLGENLARTSLFHFVANLSHKFRFSLAPNETASSLRGVNGFTISPPKIKVVITSRRCADRG